MKDLINNRLITLQYELWDLATNTSRLIFINNIKQPIFSVHLDTKYELIKRYK